MLTKIVFLDIGYASPKGNLNRDTVKMINSMSQQNLGHQAFGYFLFFDEDDAPKLTEDNVSCNILTQPIGA